jgi:hypothetical protein
MESINIKIHVKKDPLLFSTYQDAQTYAGEVGALDKVKRVSQTV